MTAWPPYVNNGHAIFLDAHEKCRSRDAVEHGDPDRMPTVHGEVAHGPQTDEQTPFRYPSAPNPEMSLK